MANQTRLGLHNMCESVAMLFAVFSRPSVFSCEVWPGAFATSTHAADVPNRPLLLTPAKPSGQLLVPFLAPLPAPLPIAPSCNRDFC